MEGGREGEEGGGGGGGGERENNTVKHFDHSGRA